MSRPEVANHQHDPTTRLPSTVLPLVYYPTDRRVFWLGQDRRVLSAPADEEGHINLGAASPAEQPPPQVSALLDDIATYTALPMRTRAADDGATYIVVWYDEVEAGTPRRAARRAWRAIRRKHSIANVFQVVDTRTGTRVTIDLLNP
jgi:hypothetical protein